MANDARTRNRKSETEWLLAIFNEFEDLDKSMSVQMAEELYLATIRRWKYYGATIFFCEVAYLSLLH